jgi:hypothetical protein
MDFFNNVGKKLGKTAKTVTKKSEELVEITKINLTIGNEEDKIKKLLSEMGSELYSRYVNGESFNEILDDKCTQVKAIEDNIVVLKDRVKNLKSHNADHESDTEIKDDVNYRLDNSNKPNNE